MGTLTPGATYIYEKADGITYAREVGADTSTRQVHGWDYDKDNPNFDPRTSDGRSLHDHIMDSKVWGEIRREAKTNKVLQDALERVIILYHLSKEHGPK